MATPPQPADETAERAARRRRRRRRVLAGLAAASVLLAGLWGAAAWYFSDVLYDDALAVSPPPAEPVPDVRVVALGGSTITLTPAGEDSAELQAAGTWGLWWEGGYGHLGDVLETDGEQVTRAFVVVAGAAPAVRAAADVDKYVFGDDPGQVLGLPWQAVTVPTELGDQDAWVVPADDAATTWAVLVHGKGSDRDEMLRMLEPVHAAGLPALVITYRGDRDQPVDPSGVYRYGATEWADLDAAVAYAVAHGAEHVVLGGASTGAAVIGSWFEHAADTSAAVGVVVDAANADVGRTFEYGASQRTVPGTSLALPPALTWTALRLAELRFPLDLAEVDYSDTLAEVDAPTLVVHGEADPRVPVEASRELVADREAAALPVTYLETSATEHVGSYNVGPTAYGDAVTALLRAAVP